MPFFPTQEENGSRDESKRLTKFLALDKCLPNRRFLQILTAGPEVGPEDDLVLSHDPAWLAVLKATNHLQSTSSKLNHMPFVASEDYAGSGHAEDIAAMDLTIRPDAFKVTAPAFDPQSPEGREPRIQAALNKVSDPERLPNPQTQFLCKALDIDDPLDVLAKNTSPEKPVKKQQHQADVSGGGSRLDLSAFLPTPTYNTEEISVERKTADNSSDDDNDLGFVIDNKGSCPTKESEDFVIDNKGELKEEDPGGQKEEVANVPTEIPPVKKLKRRNVALYKPEEDSE